MYVNSVPGVRISPSPPDFKGLLKNSSPFFFWRIVAIRDFIRDSLKTGCRPPVNAEVVQIYFCRSQVHAPKDFLRPVRIIKTGCNKAPQAVGRERRAGCDISQLAQPYAFFQNNLLPRTVMNSLNQHLFLLLNADAQASAFSICAGRTLAEWPVPIALLLVAIACYRQNDRKRFAMRTVFGTALAMGLALAIRCTFYNPRPFVLGLGRMLIEHDATTSFPSLHATFLFSALPGFPWVTGLRPAGDGGLSRRRRSR